MTNFLPQFQQLLLTLPRYNLKGVNSENCEYADTAINSKNCYYTFGAFHSEDLLYSRYSRNCKNCSDVTFCFDCEWCYECIGCSKSYGLKYSKYSDNCSNSYFLENCIGCKNCFGCINLNQKEYHFFNQPLQKDEYLTRINEFTKLVKQNSISPLVRGDVGGTRTEGGKPETTIENTWRSIIESKLQTLRLSLPHPTSHQTMTENSSGDNLVQTKNAQMCFDAYDLEDCNYCIETNSLKDCTDMTVCFKSQESYQCVHCPNNYNLKFSIHCDNCSESEFCAYSANLKNCFGCVYLKDKQYHILNKPYSPEEYKRIVTEIKQELTSQNQYNLLPYFLSDYEQHRIQSETEPAIQNSVLSA